MKTLEELKQEMDDAWYAYEAAWVAARDAEYVYRKRLKELEDENT